MPPVRPQTSFDWTLYADATFAGLAVLIPIPFLDDAFEWVFRRRMLSTIARSRGHHLPPAVIAMVNRSSGTWLAGCLRLPISLTLGLLQRLSRKLLYVLTIRAATEQLNAYWHRAFLLDYMLAAGHLDTVASAQVAHTALEQVLNTIESPFTQLARQVIGSTRHVWRTLSRARRGQAAADESQTQQTMRQQWDGFATYLETLAARYQQTYHDELARAAQPAAT